MVLAVAGRAHDRSILIGVNNANTARGNCTSTKNCNSRFYYDQICSLRGAYTKRGEIGHSNWNGIRKEENSGIKTRKTDQRGR